jgi:hypothetical protein
MHLSSGAALLLLGVALMVVSQLTIAVHAFTVSPLQGLGVLLMPLYIYVYARRHKVGVAAMRAWYAGVALWIVGAVMLT